MVGVRARGMSRLQVELLQVNAEPEPPQMTALAAARAELLQARKTLRATAAEARRWEEAVLAAQEECLAAQRTVEQLEEQVVELPLVARR